MRRASSIYEAFGQGFNEDGTFKAYLSFTPKRIVPTFAYGGALGIYDGSGVHRTFSSVTVGVGTVFNLELNCSTTGMTAWRPSRFEAVNEEVERQQSKNRFLEQKIEAIIGKIHNETERAELYLKQSSKVIVEMEAVKKTTDQNNKITAKLLNYIDLLESHDCRSEIL